MKIHLYLRWAFVYFLMIVLMGTAMRWAYVVSPFFEYRFVLHTHSHIALLGWVYIALTSLICLQFLSASSARAYKRIFWVTQLTIIGMLFSFPFQGYALYSIIFSSLFLVVSYVYTWFFFKRAKPELKRTYSYKWIALALWCMVLSSIGPWALGYIMTKLGRESALYKGAIYFYLHFQYNGWMLTAIIGLFLRYLEQKGIVFKGSIYRICLWLFGLGIFLSLLLSWIGLVEQSYLYPIGGLGVILQIMALVLLVRKSTLVNRDILLPYRNLFIFIVYLFFIKLLMQLLSSFPWVAYHTFFNVDLVIGYLHFNFLGVISLGIIYLLGIYWQIQFPKGSIIFFIGVFLATESLIFYKGFATLFGWLLFPDYFKVLALATTLFLVPVATFLISSFKKS